MKNKFLALILLAGLIFGGCAATNSQNLSKKDDKCVAVWDVQKQNEPTSYLVGAIHINYVDKKLPTCLNDALAKSNLLITETIIPVDEEEAMRPEILGLVIHLVNFENNKQLKSEIGENFYEKAKEIVKNDKEWSVFYDNLYAWSLAMVLDALIMGDNVSEDSGVDTLLFKQAKQNGIKRAWLESPMESALAFKNLPKDKIIQSIEFSLKNQEEMRVDIIKLVDTYNKGDIAALEVLVFDESEVLKYIPKEERGFWRNWVYKTLLDDRTASWVPNLLNQLPKEPTIIAVGLAHLLGENGLINVLENNGYKVTPLKQ